MRTLQSELKRVGMTKKKDKSNTKKSFTSKAQQKESNKREIEELMGIHRPTYRKHRGAFRSK